MAVDHLILTTCFASLFASLLLYLLRLRHSKKIVSNINQPLTVKPGNDDVDIIIVGAGVAGAALAHTLGKVIKNCLLLLFIGKRLCLNLIELFI